MFRSTKKTQENKKFFSHLQIFASYFNPYFTPYFYDFSNLLSSLSLWFLFLVLGGCKSPYHDKDLKKKPEDFRKLSSEPLSLSMDSTSSLEESSKKKISPKVSSLDSSSYKDEKHQGSFSSLSKSEEDLQLTASFLKIPVSLCLSGKVPLKDIFLELAQQANINIFLDPHVNGEQSLFYQAQSQSLGDVLDNICSLCHLRYEIKGQVLKILPDKPYFKTHNIQFLLGSRRAQTKTNVKTDMFSLPGSQRFTEGNHSNISMDSSHEADFWKELEKNIAMILGASPSYPQESWGENFYNKGHEDFSHHEENSEENNRANNGRENNGENRENERNEDQYFNGPYNLKKKRETKRRNQEDYNNRRNSDDHQRKDNNQDHNHNDGHKQPYFQNNNDNRGQSYFQNNNDNRGQSYFQNNDNNRGQSYFQNNDDNSDGSYNSKAQSPYDERSFSKDLSQENSIQPPLYYNHTPRSRKKSHKYPSKGLLLSKPMATKSPSPSYTLNRYAGVLTVYGNHQQQQMIEKYLQHLQRLMTTQLLIEAKIVEIDLFDDYKSGVQWQAFFNGNPQIGSRHIAPLRPSDSSSSSFDNGSFSCSAEQSQDGQYSFVLDTKYLHVLASFMERFGTVRTLANPRQSVINNQAAVLKVAHNEVFFELMVENHDGVFDRHSQITRQNISSRMQTVPIGLILYVHPSMNVETGDIVVSLHPTISRVVGFKSDPAMAIYSKKYKIDSQIPIVQMREMDSVIATRDGKVVVLGGLMEERVNNDQSQLPGVSKVPLLGSLFQQKNKKRHLVELVILLKVSLVKNNDTLCPADQRLCQEYMKDPRPF